MPATMGCSATTAVHVATAKNQGRRWPYLPPLGES